MDGSLFMLLPGTICGCVFSFFEFALAASVIFCVVALDCFHLFFYVSYATLGLNGACSLLVAIFDAAVLVGGRGLLQSYRVLRVLVIGDLVTSTLTFVAGCTSAAFFALYLVIHHFAFNDFYSIYMGILAIIDFYYCFMTACFFVPNLQRSLVLLPNSGR